VSAMCALPFGLLTPYSLPTHSLLTPYSLPTHSLLTPYSRIHPFIHGLDLHPPSSIHAPSSIHVTPPRRFMSSFVRWEVGRAPTKEQLAKLPVVSSMVCNAVECPNPHSPAPTPVLSAQELAMLSAKNLTPGMVGNGKYYHDCQMSAWSLWSHCSDKCAGGVRQRTRHPQFSYSQDNLGCPSRVERENCNTQPCPIHCAYTWSSWSECDRQCGTGMQSSQVQVYVQPEEGGHNCPLIRFRYRPCNTQDCAPTPPPPPSRAPTAGPTRRNLHSAFPESMAPSPIPTGAPSVPPPTPPPTLAPTPVGWDALVRSGQATQNPVRIPRKPATYAPTSSPTIPAVECVVSAWLGWSVCSEKCGSGVRSRKRLMMRAPRDGGHPCPALEENAVCNEGPCPVHCEHSWLPWTVCSRSCAAPDPKGTQQRGVVIITEPEHGGIACPY
jgi:hypothetical protein